MPAHSSVHTLIAIVFVLAMLGLGSVNPHAAFGEASCGLTCGGLHRSVAPF